MRSANTHRVAHPLRGKDFSLLTAPLFLPPPYQPALTGMVVGEGETALFAQFWCSEPSRFEIMRRDI
jgi:hypothetical protein